jgi:hypothetical protein
MDIQTRRISTIAQDMRRAIEAAPKDKLPFPMAKFPRAACMDASLLLGAYLVDCGENDFLYVCGERGLQDDKTWTSHGWLARDNLIVDITADQFEDAPTAVIVERNSVWHRQFRGSRLPERSDFRVWTGCGTDHLHTIYARLEPQLRLAQRFYRD